jgi:hypothetical protein
MNLCVTGIRWLNECDWKQKPKLYTKTRRKLKKKHASSNFLSGMISRSGNIFYYWLMMLYHSRGVSTYTNGKLDKITTFAAVLSSSSVSPSSDYSKISSSNKHFTNVAAILVLVCFVCLSGMISVQGDGISSWESIFYWLMMLYHACIINFMS